MIEYQNGIHLKGTELWFDAKKKVGLSFISSADIASFTPPEKILATPETIKFIEKKIKKPVVLACPYYRPFALGDMEVELVPAGTMLGSSQLILDKGDKTLLYSGNVNIKKLPTTDPAYTKHCDVLAMKCPFGIPDYKFPAFDQSMTQLEEFINETQSTGKTPVLVVEPIGIAQDITKTLGDKGFKLSLEKTIHKFTKVYEDLGINFSGYETLNSSDLEGRVVLTTSKEIESKEISSIKNMRLAILAESTEVEKFAIKSKYDAQAVITFSNHADNDDLIEFVDSVKPEKVYLIEQHANQFAPVLEHRGYEVISLEKPTQLNLL